MRRTADDVVTVGQALIRQRVAMPGLFYKWLEFEFDMSERSAYRFIHVAEQFSNRPGTVPGLGLKALYELAAPSTPPEVQAEVERRIAAGDLVNAADIKALKQEAKTAAQRAVDFERKADTLEERNRDLVANAHASGSERHRRGDLGVADNAGFVDVFVRKTCIRCYRS